MEKEMRRIRRTRFDLRNNIYNVFEGNCIAESPEIQFIILENNGEMIHSQAISIRLSGKQPVPYVPTCPHDKIDGKKASGCSQ